MFPVNYPPIYALNNSNNSIFKNEIKDHLDSANTIAQQILIPNYKMTRNSRFRKEHYIGRHVRYKSSVNFTYIVIGPTVHHHHYGRRPTTVTRRSEGSNAAVRVLVGLTAGIVAAVGSYYIGQGISHVKGANKQLREDRDFKICFKKETRDYSNHEHVSKINTIVKAKERIFTHIRDNAVASVALTISLVAGAVLALIGALAASVPLMIAGGVVGFLAVCGHLTRWGYVHSRNPNKKQAQIISRNYEDLMSANRRVSQPVRYVQNSNNQNAFTRS